MRQYIGARYVPKFLGTYSATTVYEALDVVDDGLGTSYIAKIPTPAGTPLTNTTYWAMYGASSGAVINLQNQIGDITDLNTGLTNTDLVSAINDVDDKVNDVSKYVTGRKIVLITDSYGSRVNAANKNCTAILQDYGLDIVDAQIVSGGSYAATDAAKQWYNYVDLYTGDKLAVTDVLFCGSINDGLYTYNEILTSATSVLSFAKTTYPNAKIHCIFWGACLTDSTLSDEAIDIIPMAYQAACAKTGAIYAENAQYMLKNSTLLQSDLVHPNNAGVDYMSWQVYNYFVTGSIDVYHEITATASIHSGGATIQNMTASDIIMRRHNGEVDVMFKDAPLNALDFEVVTPAAGINDLGYAIDITETLVSFSNIGKNYATLKGYARNQSPFQIESGVLRVLFNRRFMKIALCGQLYGSSYDRFISLDNCMHFSD